jgi:ATP-dependent exoDNAse (exonuclease V) beta subunit
MTSLTPHQSKALKIDRSISLTANAGSGKTFVLAQRYLEIILNTDTPLSQVAAITFLLN